MPLVVVVQCPRSGAHTRADRSAFPAAGEGSDRCSGCCSHADALSRSHMPPVPDGAGTRAALSGDASLVSRDRMGRDCGAYEKSDG